MFVKSSALHPAGLVKAASLLSILCLVLMVVPATSLHAEPLSKQACKDLREKQQKLLQLPAVQDMGKGFEWVKSNSKPSEIQSIKLYIETEEQLKFRCPKQKLKKKKKKIIKPIKKPVDLKTNAAVNSADDNKTKKKLEPKKKAPKEETANKQPVKKPVKKAVKKKVQPKKKPQKPKTKPKKQTEKQPEPTLLDDIIATIQDAATPITDEKKQ